MNKYIMDTPIEKIIDNKLSFFVKREDLACCRPGPPFAKVRGIYEHLLKLKKNKIKDIAYFETSISMATWGICYFAKILNLNTHVYYYEYKNKNIHNRRRQLKIWNFFGTRTYKIEKPNMQKVQEAISEKLFYKTYPKNSHFLKAGLQFDETITEVSKQTETLNKIHKNGSIIIACGSGTMAAGVLNGLSKDKEIINQDVYCILVHSKNTKNMLKSILKKAKMTFLLKRKIKINIIDNGYNYTTPIKIETPFPCCPYYDKKAYNWLIKNYDKLKKPILFWNIGGSYNTKRIKNGDKNGRKTKVLLS